MAKVKAAKGTTDETTLQLIAEVARQKKEISKAERSVFATNCSFSYTERGSDATNLQVESDVRKLICIAAFLAEKEKTYDTAAKALGVTEPPEFTWQGFTVGDWLEDIKVRITRIQITAKKKKLATLETRLNAIISPELRAKMELEAIANELK